LAATEKSPGSNEGHSSGLFRRGERACAAEEAQGEEVSIVIAQLKRIARAAGLEFSLRVGAVIIHHCYGGDINGWRSRGPKAASFRRLAQHPELPMSPGSIYRCVAIFELCERLNAASRWEHLGTSHLRLVLGMPPAAQERLLKAANSERWTVRALQKEVLRQHASRLMLGGRRMESPVTKSLKHIEKALVAHRELMIQAQRPSLGDVERSLKLISETEECLEQLKMLMVSIPSARAT
jgi:hypothetical protein